MTEQVMDNDWIVIAGQPVDTTRGGGFEFFGPFTEQEAQDVRAIIIAQHNRRQQYDECEQIVLAVQLLSHYQSYRVTERRTDGVAVAWINEGRKTR